MEKTAAQELVQRTLQSSFNKEDFVYLVKNILNRIEEAPFTYQGNFIFDDFADSIRLAERVGKYESPDGKLIDILIIHLREGISLERARTKQRNFVAKYLKGSRGGVLKDAALAAFVASDGDDWRLSFVKMDYKFNEQGKVKEEFTPARRYSFLVGQNEKSHTAQSCLLPLLINDEVNPTLGKLEEVFSVERVTKEFFEKYRDLYSRLKGELDGVAKNDNLVKEDFRGKNITTSDFCKKLLGQIVFLYFLQKKGWFGVPRNKKWGEGDRQFLRRLFKEAQKEKGNYFNDFLEPLFYEALRYDRRASDDYFSRFDCKIPFLNGGLFDPINDYDWINTEILLHNSLFSNSNRTKEGDIGDGILDIFDRYNFTVKEDEPLEKEVAIDPEMLGKVFENLLEDKDRKSKGTYYTPREIVHYMCQESLANYLTSELEGKVSKEDVEMLIKHGEMVVEHDSHVVSKGHETDRYSFRLPQNVRQNAKIIDEKLTSIRVCDPAVGSGAFPVGMMNEIVRTRNALTPHISENNERTSYNFKREAIQNCLYGVDIDPSAVEIAKLRLWLSLVVDEEERRNIRPLPNLDYKIVRGNSLLRVRDVLNDKLFGELETLKPRYFNETDARKKREYQLQINGLINEITNDYKDFDFEIYFSEVFHEKDGFDIVISNPPYVSALEAKKLIEPKERNKYKENYVTARGAYDLYILFFELGVSNIKNKGILTFISPSKYLSAKYASALRKHLLKYSLLELVDLSKIKAFESAAVSTLVTIIKKDEIQGPIQTLKPTTLIDIRNGVKIINERRYLTLFPENLWGFLLSNHINLVKKVWEQSTPMSEVAQVGASSTASEAGEYSKYISQNKTSNSQKIINTKTVDRVFNHWGRLPYKNKDKMIRKPFLDTSKINRRRSEMYKKEKLIFSKVASSITASYDANGEFASTNTNFIYDPKTVSVAFLAGYINSSLSNFLYKQIFGGLGMFSSYQFQAPQLRILPAPKRVEYKKDIEDAVTKILELGNTGDYLEDSAKQAKVRQYEKQIDQLVYKLYKLTPEEIEIVENS